MNYVGVPLASLTHGCLVQTSLRGSINVQEASGARTVGLAFTVGAATRLDCFTEQPPGKGVASLFRLTAIQTRREKDLTYTRIFVCQHIYHEVHTLS